MIISRTPLRVSFFGGGTDYPEYFRRHGGETLVTTIDKFVTVSVHHLTEFFDHRIQVHYSKVESVKELDEIQISVVRETLRFLGIDRGVEIHLVGDLPARTGLGSSGATTVGLLQALHGFRGDCAGALQLAQEAVHVEQEMIREPVGCQDQYACAQGGLVHLTFATDGTVGVRPVAVEGARLAELESRLLLFYTGLQRSAREVLGEQMDRTADGSLDGQLERMKQQVRAGIEVLTGAGDLDDFGRILDEAWAAKRSLSSQISNPWLDDLYAAARRAGCLGGKLLGAGAGGFLLLYADPARQAALREALVPLREVSFRLESRGARIVYDAP